MKINSLKILLIFFALCSLFNSGAIFSTTLFEDSQNKTKSKKSKYSNNLRTKFLASTINNPNLLDIEGPDVSLIFKQAKAKEIFEYLAEIGNFGFVWVKNSPNKENDVDNQRLISMSSKSFL